MQLSPAPGTPLLWTRGASGLTGVFIGPLEIPGDESLWVIMTPQGLVCEHPANVIVDD